MVFGILKRGGRVYTQAVEDTKTETLMGQIRAKVMPDIFSEIVPAFAICHPLENSTDSSQVITLV